MVACKFFFKIEKNYLPSFCGTVSTAVVLLLPSALVLTLHKEQIQKNGYIFNSVKKWLKKYIFSFTYSFTYHASPKSNIAAAISASVVFSKLFIVKIVARIFFFILTMKDSSIKTSDIEPQR